MSDNSIPPKCPSCGDRLIVVKLQCTSCGTELNGEFDVCPVCTLEGENRQLFQLFLEARGNLKKVQRKLGVSYPTVRQRMENVFSQLENPDPPPDPKEVLERLEEGEIDVERALKLLAGD